MKLLPTILVLAAFLVLLYLSSLRPGTAGEDINRYDDTVASGPLGAALAPGVDPEPAAPETPPSTHAPAPATSEPAGPPPSQPIPPPEPPQPAAARQGTVTGVVLTPAESAAPGMSVQLLKGSEVVQTATTGDDGRFEFRVADDGTYALSARDPNFLYTASERVSVQAGGESGAEATLHVYRGTGTITGTALSTKGMPLEGQAIALKSANLEFSVAADNKGNFRLGGLPAGNWLVSVANHPESAATVRLGEGETNHVDLPPVLFPAALVLKFAASDLHPFHFTGEEVVSLQRVDEEGDPVQAGLDEEGGVQFHGLEPGTYEIAAVDAAGDVIIPKPVQLILSEGEERTRVLSMVGSIRGAGVTVPMWAKVSMVLFFLVAFSVPVLLFPPPFKPVRPATAPPAAPPTPDESASASEPSAG